MPGVDFLLGAFREQHCRGELTSGQAAAQGFAHHLRVAAQGQAPILTAAHDSIQVLIPEQGELAESVEPTLYESADEREIDRRTACANFAVHVQVEYADVGQF